jgi:HPt (histidine-containing phosphotransfer) domain-containing protein
MFKKLKDKAMGALLRRQLKKSGLPEDQQEMMVSLVLENPEFFQKIEAEVKEKKNQGMDEQAAMMTVMRAHQSELQKLMMKKGK